MKMNINIDNFEWRPDHRTLFSKTATPLPIDDFPYEGFTIIGKTRSVGFNRIRKYNYVFIDPIVTEAKRMGMSSIFIFYNEDEHLSAVLCLRRK